MFLRGMVLPTWSRSIVSASGGPSPAETTAAACVVGQGREIGMHAVRHDGQPIAVGQAVREDRIARGHAVARHPRRAPKAVENPPRHRAERRGAPLDRWVEHAAKRIDVVAGDDGPLRRKLAHQMGVAVVDDVKNVNVVARLAEPPRIVEQPVRKPIEREGGLRASGKRHRSRPTAERRLKPDRLDVAPLPAEALDEHLGDEVHARPLLFCEIAHHTDAKGLTGHTQISPIPMPEPSRLSTSRMDSVRAASPSSAQSRWTSELGRLRSETMSWNAIEPAPADQRSVPLVVGAHGGVPMVAVDEKEVDRAPLQVPADFGERLRGAGIFPDTKEPLVRREKPLERRSRPRSHRIRGTPSANPR